MEKLVEDLKSILCGDRVVLACIGSPLRMDDQAGLLVCDKLVERGVTNTVRCEYGLENCLGEISSLKPDTLIVVDAVYSNKLSPGDVVLLNSEAVEAGEYGLEPVSTHNIPFKISLSLLKETVGLKNTYLLGIMVKNIDLGTEVSEEVRKAVDYVVELIVRAYRECEKS